MISLSNIIETKKFFFSLVTLILFFVIMWQKQLSGVFKISPRCVVGVEESIENAPLL
jgi:hypothetical protein